MRPTAASTVAQSPVSLLKEHAPHAGPESNGHGPSCIPATELAALANEYDCRTSLATGLGREGLAVAIAEVHRRRGNGRHICIDPSKEEASKLLTQPSDLLGHIEVIATEPIQALPQQLDETLRVDLAIIQGPKCFEDAFLEFLFIDRMLVTGGLLAVCDVSEHVTQPLAEYLGQARSYETRSPTGSASLVWRKLGNHRPNDAPAPAAWQSPSDASNIRTMESAVLSGPEPIQGAATGTGNRVLFQARARVADLEVRTRTLAARLLEAEADADRELTALRRELAAAKMAHEQAEYWLARITSSASWRLTAPLRSLKKHRRS